MKYFQIVKSMNAPKDIEEGSGAPGMEDEEDLTKNAAMGYGSEVTAPKARFGGGTSTSTTKPSVTRKSVWNFFHEDSLNKATRTQQTTPGEQSPPGDPDAGMHMRQMAGEDFQEENKAKKEFEKIPAGTGKRLYKGDYINKSLESRYGSQMAKSFDVPTSCGICNRITKSLDGNVCGTCQYSMGVTQWHDSHLR